MHQSTTGSPTSQFLEIDSTQQKAYLHMHIFTRKVHWSSIAKKAIIDFRCFQIQKLCILAIIYRSAQYFSVQPCPFIDYMQGVRSKAKGKLYCINLGWQMTCFQLLCSILVAYDIITIIRKFMFIQKFRRRAPEFSRYDLPSSFSSPLRITVFMCFCWWFSFPRDMILKKV
jgi:hypothetical protein